MRSFQERLENRIIKSGHSQGLSEDPSEQRMCSQGLRVRPLERYPNKQRVFKARLE